MVSKNEEFCIKNEELCVQNDDCSQALEGVGSPGPGFHKQGRVFTNIMMTSS